MSKRLRIILMGTPDFSVPAFEAVINHSGHDVIAIYTQPPRPKGRGHKVQQSPVHDLAEAHGIPVYTPHSLKKTQTDAIATFQNLEADLAVVAAYGLILPKAVLDAPTYGCVNIHASLLPKWRGASPIHHAIWKGDRQTGITLMHMDVGLDTGDMIAKQTLPITNKTTLKTLHDNLAQLGAEMLITYIDSLAINQAPQATPQDDDAATYAPLLKKSDGLIDWSHSAEAIDRQIRALDTFTHCHGKRLKVHQTLVATHSSSETAGTIINKNGDVACGDGTVLTLLSIQPEGKKPMAFRDVLNGGLLHVGDVLS